ncbi:hypothetical protein PV10_06771 [Exophiala mesophila]|uniref:Membrane insertase YidC/Oxa/ALB C-terminal domain-containing protein n=1 Tax=Exophiala mesophila TaxID=212818 RepID=A0A0D1ZEF2_EXOME|nr:uncharacterized protein PV10_06771 [Exophiala mesophila]KIV92319.1 hypothetical protein PV10_06771 [Exophiala mesophila]
MTISQGLRWSGRGITNGKHRVTTVLSPQAGVRHYSLRTLRSSLSHSHPPVTSNSVFLQQSRSLSLFGWGSPSKPDDFAKAHPSSSSVPEAPPPLETVRTVKASHGTSDAPDPSIATSTPTPTSTLSHPASENILERLEDKLLTPAGAHSPNAPGAEIDLASIPEGIGYLKDVCGLDFGWGPTATMEWFFEHIHIWGGLSWGMSIVGLAVLFRVVLLPLSLRSVEASAKMQQLKPILDPLRKEMQAAAEQNDKVKVLKIRQDMQAAMKQANFSFSSIFLPMAFQIPFSYGAFRLLREAGHLPVPGFESDSLLWLSNLSTSDPTYALPLIIGGVTFLNLRQSARTAPDSRMMNMLKTILPGFSFVFMCFQPVSTNLFFLVTGLAQSTQLSIFQNAAFRRWYNLPPMPRPSDPAKAGTISYGSMNVASGQGTPPNSSHSSSPSSTTSSTASSPSSSPSSSLPAGPSQNRSWIDQRVDKAKESWKQGLIGSSFKESKDKADAKARERKRANWESLRKEEIAAERERRNRDKR